MGKSVYHRICLLQLSDFRVIYLLTRMYFTKPPGSPPAVPVPQALLLFGAGLLGLAGIARRK